MKKKLYILAPNDRFNYGDLLFPYIIKHYFSSDFDDLIYVSTTMSNLSDKGGFITEKHSVLYKLSLDSENHLIVAGGESLCAEWLNILSFIYPLVDFFNRLSKKFSPNLNKVCELIVKKILGYKTHYPFSIGKYELPHLKTISYNALGGTFLQNSNELDSKDVKKILNSIDYFTVRDGVTSAALTKRKIRHSICPDTAILMDEVFSEDVLLANISVSPSIINNNYIFFQGKPGHWDGNYELASLQLMELSKVTNYKICLCPIGMALGHTDSVALRRIADLMTDNYFEIKDPNIFDIMWLIKHSKMYIGVSLHGAISAMSFNVPYIGYGSLKVKYYFEQWADVRRFTTIDKIKDSAIYYLNKDIDSTLQKKLVMEFFNKLHKLYK